MIIPYIFNETDTKIIQVTPNIDNDGAIRLYNKLNFKKVGDLVTYKTKAASIECQYMELKKKDFNNFKLNKK
jgi:RimJ/RimL family protein N-acetyltransferase